MSDSVFVHIFFLISRSFIVNSKSDPAPQVLFSALSSFLICNFSDTEKHDSCSLQNDYLFVQL